MAKIFLTGITGFLGSNIARYLINQGHELMATYRSTSVKDQCIDFEEKVNWILQDAGWEKKVCAFLPEVILHSAWIGVNHTERSSWDIQYQNIEFLNSILLIARQSNTAKFICLGSQAEYGLFEGCISENHELKPTEAYGHIKVVCAEMVKQFCDHHKINWYWLRLFSFFGRGESPTWLIPSLVNKILTTKEMDFTPGEQKYAYLYVNDLGLAINKIVETKENVSGIFNISGSTAIKLKELIEKITQQIKPEFQLNFGKLPYRPNQPMHMQGDSNKFKKLIGDFEVSDFNDSLNKTVKYLIDIHSNHSNS